MRVLVMKGHERNITRVVFSPDGDLLFSAASDKTPTVWDTESGERIGTYNGHSGSITDLSVSWDSTRLITASGDCQVKLWDVQTGEELLTYVHSGPVRGCSWAEGADRFATVCDALKPHAAKVQVFRAPQDQPVDTYTTEPEMLLEIPPGERPTRVYWTLFNEHLLVLFESGFVRKFDPKTGELIQEAKLHEEKVNLATWDKNKIHFITASNDMTAKLVDAKTLEVLKEYKTDRPVNGAVISPVKDHVLLGGGQDAQSVTTTRGQAGKFETRFFHKIYEEEFGRVKGHFGPITCVDISPDGLKFASGSFDGYVRLHAFDEDYLFMKDEVPEDF